MLQNRPTFRWIDKLMEQYDTPILCMRIGPSTHIVVVTSPDIACEFLKKQDAIFASRPEVLSAYITSEGYCSTVMSPLGNQWKKMRKIVNQNVLSMPIHKWLQPKRDEEANHLLLYIYNQIKKPNGLTDGGLVNIRTVSQHYCGNLMRHVIFGSRFFGEGTEDGGPGKEETEHVSALFTILEYLYAFCITDYFQWLRGKTDFDGHEKIIRTANSSVRKYHDPLIIRRIQMWNDGVRNEEDDLLDVLIKHENPKLTLDEIKAQIGVRFANSRCFHLQK
ncbi:tyrosine N-monooxygenase [Artemisia annua]|uniref:Tyrosine N-monooxygenase n=1 Tax=Artemisia annua TaxID=35608 RepID=A0A2U1MZB4_ARTAN|nr:tyrosine N-monooxygenase [Artemisia annua]